MTSIQRALRLFRLIKDLESREGGENLLITLILIFSFTWANLGFFFSTMACAKLQEHIKNVETKIRTVERKIEAIDARDKKELPLEEKQQLWDL